MRVTQLLVEIDRINRADGEAAAEFGPLELGPRGVEVSELVCVDGFTRVITSPQIREFYAYAISWRHSSMELEWFAPRTPEECPSHRSVREMVASDTAPWSLMPVGLAPSSAVLFALDNRAAPVERAYFVFGDSVEPRVVYAGSEISVFDDLTGYLDSHLQALS